MTDDSDEERERPARVRPSKKSIDAMLQRVARPAWRSPLFWWLIDHHDELRQAEVNTGRGVTWQSLCEDFPDQGITLADGRPVTPATAKRTWQRVRKEIVRVEERRARELAEREARRAADPRRNMPSRFPKGEYGPPLSSVQPGPPPARALVPAPRQTPVVVSATSASARDDEYCRDMVLPECLKDTCVVDWDNSVLDLRQFFRNDGIPEPWDNPNLDPGDREAEMKLVIWMRAKEWARYRPYDRRHRSKW
jgi:hypothetical protein